MVGRSNKMLLIVPLSIKNLGTMTSPMTHMFAKIKLPASQVFFENDHIFAFVNIKPVLPGHVLLCPKRIVHRYGDLTDEEASQLAIQAKKIGSVLEKMFNATALNLVCQDGDAAGQSVPHCHLHIMPRQMGDFDKPDDMYDVLEGRVHVDSTSTYRSEAVMKEEADRIREALAKL